MIRSQAPLAYGWEMRLPQKLRLSLLLFLTVAMGCSGEKSFVVVTVSSMTGTLSPVAQLVVDVHNGALQDSLSYPKNPTARLTLSETKSETFSVSFDTSFMGNLDLGVTALTADGTPMAYGTATATIDPSHTARAKVVLIPGTMAPDWFARDGGTSVDDGGAPIVSDGSAKLDAVSMCSPAAPATCGANKTCTVNCTTANQAIGLCAAAGKKKAGETCSPTGDCEPGSQCLARSCAGMPQRNICLKFCQKDGDCGTGARCTTPVPCGPVTSSFRICSQACDPTGAATTGCATGLFCFLYGEEATDCDCRDPGRTGTDGNACSTSDNCQPGFICVDTGGTKTCRAICNLSTGACTPGTVCTRLIDPPYTVYGACLAAPMP